jgi:hypothetical protein
VYGVDESGMTGDATISNLHMPSYLSVFNSIKNQDSNFDNIGLEVN